MARKLFIQTHGCQMNEYDSTRMVDLLESTHNLEPTDNPEDADVLLLNTCSIREKAQEKVFHQLGRWKRLKERNPELIIGVGGCVASQEGEAIRERAPYVDVVFGPQTLHRLPGLITQAASTRSLAIDVTFPEIEKFDNLPEPGAAERDPVAGFVPLARADFLLRDGQRVDNLEGTGAEPVEGEHAVPESRAEHPRPRMVRSARQLRGLVKKVFPAHPPPTVGSRRRPTPRAGPARF